MQIIAEASTVVGLRVISTGPLRVKNKNLFSRKNQIRSRVIWCVSRSLLYHSGGNSLVNFWRKKRSLRLTIVSFGRGFNSGWSNISFSQSSSKPSELTECLLATEFQLQLVITCWIHGCAHLKWMRAFLEHCRCSYGYRPLCLRVLLFFSNL